MQSYRLVISQGIEQTDLRLVDLDTGGAIVRQRTVRSTEVKGFLARVEAAYSNFSPQLAQIGDEIGEWIDGPTERWLDFLPGPEEGVALHVDVEGRLRHVPWELARRGGALRCENPHRTFVPVRCVRTTERDAEVCANRPLRVLFVAASPEDALPVLEHEWEEARILEATRSTPIDLFVEESGTLRGLHARIRAQGGEPFDVLHLTGHAELRASGPCFLFENDFGGEHAVTASELAAELGARWPRLVVLSGCSTAEVGAGHVLSFCEALVNAGAPAVVGWALAVGDRSATEASGVLYAQLASGARIDRAVGAARLQLIDAQSKYWHALRLYADATPLGALVTPEGSAGRVVLAVQPTKAAFLDAGSRVEVCAAESFIGRRRAIQRCLRVLRSPYGGDEHAGGVVVHGLGGLGKSSLAARICDRMRDTHALFVWAGRLDISGFLRAVKSATEGATTDREASLKQQVTLLLCDLPVPRSTLFVFDDFEQNFDGNAGAGQVSPEAVDILTTLLETIHAGAPESRVIVTSRFAFGLGAAPETRLHHEPLESLREAELTKKMLQLRQLRPGVTLPPTVYAHALALAGGNPRLLEQLAVLVSGCTPGNPASTVLIDATIATFREEQFLPEIVTRLRPVERRVVAALALVDLPIGEDAVVVISGEPDLPLSPLSALGLLEVGVDPASGRKRYAVSAVVRPLVEGDLSPPDRAAIQASAARTLLALWWRPTGETTIERAQELHRLALSAGDGPIAAEMAAAIAREWIPLAHYHEAASVCKSTLLLVNDYRVLHALARAEHALGDADAAAGHFEAALAAFPDTEDHEIILERAALLHNTATLLAARGDVEEAIRRLRAALVLHARIGDLESRANTLDKLASVLARRGHMDEAFEAWREAHDIHEQACNWPGVAATLSNSAGFIAQRGDIDEAMRAWERALALQQRAGDDVGRAATLAGIADVEARQGRLADALLRWHEAEAIYGMVGDVEGEATMLNNMADALYDAGQRRDAVALWKRALALFTRLGDVEGRATVLGNLAEALASEGRVRRAQKLLAEALADFQRIGDIDGQAGTLGRMAGICLEQGRAEKALSLWQEALPLYERINDLDGHASTRGNIAAVLVERGPDGVQRAIELFRGALMDFERIGEMGGVATTLGNIGCAMDRLGDLQEAEAHWAKSLARHRGLGDHAGVAGMLVRLANLAWRRGEHGPERMQYREAATEYASVRAWPDVASTLEEIDGVDSAETQSYRAQAFWLCLRVEVPVDRVFRLAEALVVALGAGSPASPRIVAATLTLIKAGGQDAPEGAAMTGRCQKLLRACASASGVESGQFRAWLTTTGLLRRKQVMAGASADVEALVPESAWLFDRAAVEEGEPEAPPKFDTTKATRSPTTSRKL